VPCLKADLIMIVYKWISRARKLWEFIIEPTDPFCQPVEPSSCQAAFTFARNAPALIQRNIPCSPVEPQGCRSRRATCGSVNRIFLLPDVLDLFARTIERSAAPSDDSAKRQEAYAVFVWLTQSDKYYFDAKGSVVGVARREVRRIRQATRHQMTTSWS
jgi:hypothetical protein